jgi:rhodanese-related sulfurtransferase
MPEHITREDLRRRMEAGEVTVVEATPSRFYEEQHLPGAINIDHLDIAAEAPARLPDRSAPVVTYCDHLRCQNPSSAARRLEALGYTSVLEYAEGKDDWVAAGLPTEAGPEPAA